MSKLILINSNEYDLELLAQKSDYFMAMFNFESKNIIDITHRGRAYEIIIKILLDDYIFNEEYFIHYDEIIELRNELMLNDKIKTIEEMCNCIVQCIGETKKINSAIRRHQNSKLTKKQKKSEQYLRQTQYWEKIKYLDLTLTLEENEIIYKENNSLIKDRYEGSLNFDVIIKAYTYKELLEISPFLIFEQITTYRNTGNMLINYLDNKNFLIMKNDFELKLNGVKFTPNNNFNNYICNNKIITLHLISCYFECEFGNKYDFEYIVKNLIILGMTNLKFLKIKNFKIKNLCGTDSLSEIKILLSNTKNIKCEFDDYYISQCIDICGD